MIRRRLSLIQMSDHRYVMNHGKIFLSGTQKELINNRDVHETVVYNQELANKDTHA